jgi:hypothetical protein
MNQELFSLIIDYDKTNKLDHKAYYLHYVMSLVTLISGFFLLANITGDHSIIKFFIAFLPYAISFSLTTILRKSIPKKLKQIKNNLINKIRENVLQEKIIKIESIIVENTPIHRNNNNEFIQAENLLNFFHIYQDYLLMDEKKFNEIYEQAKKIEEDKNFHHLLEKEKELLLQLELIQDLKTHHSKANIVEKKESLLFEQKKYLKNAL